MLQYNHYETIHLGCEKTAQIARPGRSHLIRFCNGTMHATCTIGSHLNEAFVKAQLLANENITNKPFYISVLWPTALTDIGRKRKEEDSESSFYKMKWYFENYIPPTNGLVVSFYIVPTINAKHESIWQARYIWPTKKQWNTTNKFISIQMPEKLIGVAEKKDVLDKKFEEFIPIIESYAVLMNCDIKYINYSTPMEETYKVMLETKCHITYEGSSYYMAASTGTPVIGINHNESKNIIYDKAVVHNPDKGYFSEEKTWIKTRWGHMASNCYYIPTLEKDTKKIINRTPTNYKTAYCREHLTKYLNEVNDVTN